MAIAAHRHAVRGLAAAAYNSGDWQLAAAAVAMGANDGIDLDLAGGWLQPATVAERLNVANSTSLRSPSVITSTSLEGTIRTMWSYAITKQLMMIANHFGTEVTAQIGISTAYTHLLTYDEDWYGRHYSLGFTDRLVLHEIPFAKTEKVHFHVEENQIGFVEFGVVCDREITNDGGTNTLAAFNAAVTIPSQLTVSPIYVTLANAVVRINAFSGGDVESATARTPSLIDLNFERSVERIRSTSRGLIIDEPVGGDWRLVNGTIGFKRDEVVADYAWMTARTPLKMSVTISGGDAGSGNLYRYLFQYPHIVLDTAGLPKALNAQISKVDFKFEAERPLTDPTAMAFRDPRLTITEQTTTNLRTSA